MQFYVIRMRMCAKVWWCVCCQKEGELAMYRQKAKGKNGHTGGRRIMLALHVQRNR